MPLQSETWVYDLSGMVKIPAYGSVERCPKCKRKMIYNGKFTSSRKEKYQVSRNGYSYITSYDATIKDGTMLTMDEYIEVTCKDCGYGWAEACADYTSPEIFEFMGVLFTMLPIFKEHVNAAFAAEAAEAEARAKKSVALMKAGAVELVDGEIIHSEDQLPSQWEIEAATSLQPFSMESPEEQAKREVDALTPVLDTPEETVLPTKREMFLRRAWHSVDPHVKMLIPPVALWIYILWHIL